MLTTFTFQSRYFEERNVFDAKIWIAYEAIVELEVDHHPLVYFLYQTKIAQERICCTNSFSLSHESCASVWKLYSLQFNSLPNRQLIIRKFNFMGHFQIIIQY